jgi:hypothetical protein
VLAFGFDGGDTKPEDFMSIIFVVLAFGFDGGDMKPEDFTSIIFVELSLFCHVIIIKISMDLLY